MNLSDPREHVQWKQPAVLLIDGDPKRQAERAAGLRRSGMMVECAANGASAAALWEPEKYQLILVELFEADLDVRPFCENLQARSPQQKMGVYCPDRPFIRQAREALLFSIIERPRASRSDMGESAVARRQRPISGLVEAAQRIAALRRRIPIYVKPLPRQEELRQEERKPESHASVAARVLGGEQ